jgi:nitrate reductase delta subunit
MTLTFKALSVLLSYPEADLVGAVADIRAVLDQEALVPAFERRLIDKLLDEIATLDLYELQERYVFLFDRTRSLSLHLFEHVHGESRDRGQAMVDLRSLYEQGGLDVDTRELPDYLPLFLEFLSLRPLAEARALLQEPIGVISALRERLSKRKTPYAGVFRALEAIAGGSTDVKLLNALRRAPDDDPNDLEALDALWEDAPVTFGPGDSRCSEADPIVRQARDAKISIMKEELHG